MKFRRICVDSWEITNNQGNFRYTRLLTLYAEIPKNKIHVVSFTVLTGEF